MRFARIMTFYCCCAVLPASLVLLEEKRLLMKICNPISEMTSNVVDLVSSQSEMSNDGPKYMIPISVRVTVKGNNTHPPCTAIFMGGTDEIMVAEQKLRQVYPQCKTRIGIMDYLRHGEEDNSHPIDLLMVDEEQGDESTIISHYIDFPAHLKRTICQLNFKVHTPQSAFAQKGAASRFLQQLDDWLESGRYALVHVDARGPDSEFMRLLLVDVEDPECRRKFLCG